ncbi:TetR/AcrR family transcriptional regulator [Actinoplanes friuliensis]|uniref:TetR family transcriptional regulator n=1 Tax=Actinoplanes friuliensis DSM 7358 TaxID=1246995 RepID=U5VY99_9ACTN|nr:TetR/AcrR family transcriptional regulator [Actinoplanes friuliensis]AGZ40685.1 TetR family transcriptional regulator [Actinoplanes friuliensis DSM 7358]
MPRARLTPQSVTEAGAALIDEVGFEKFSMGLLAERLGVKTPALYKHVTSQADLAHRIAIVSMAEFADAIRDAIQGRAGSDALAAGAQAMRAYVQEHPGRYAAADAARPTGPDDPLIPAINRVVASWAAMLRGYHLDSSQEIHAVRMLRSALHGFSTQQAAGGFRYDASVDDSFTWMINFLDHGLHVAATSGISVTPASTATPATSGR